jgi:hypothetical protein
MKTWKDYASEANRSADEMKIIALHNAECAFIAEVMPKVLECYNKYAGKNVGEKTEAKIREAIEEIIDADNFARVYIDNDGIRYYVRNEWKTAWFGYYQTIENICGRDTEVSRRYGKWDKNGKLNRFTMDMFVFDEHTIIENAEVYLAEKREKIARYKELCNEIEAVRKEYNDNLCDGFKEMRWQVADSYFRMR